MMMSIVLWSILVLSTIIVTCVVYLFGKRHQEIKVNRIKEDYIEQKQKLWDAFFRDEDVSAKELVPRNKFEVEAIEEIFFVYLTNLKTPMIVEKIQMFSNEFLYDYFLAQLKSRKWSTRINAMGRVLDFKMDRLVDVIVNMQADKLTKEENFKRLKVFAHLKEQGFVEEFLQVSGILSEYEYKRILIDIEDSLFNDLLAQFTVLPSVCQYAVLDLLGIKRDSDYLLFLETQLSNEDPEVRIRALKAIYEIGLIEDIGKYERFSHSSLWEERLIFSKILEYVQVEIAQPFLSQSIKDESWWVRFQAGKTISKYRNGNLILKDIIEKETDQFAVDMANSFLKEGDSL